MTDFRVNKPALKVAALLMVGGLVAGCGTSSPDAINYKSDSRSKQASLAVPPNLLDETGDQRSLPPQGGQATLSDLQQVQKAAPNAINQFAAFGWSLAAVTAQAVENATAGGKPLTRETYVAAMNDLNSTKPIGLLFTADYRSDHYTLAQNMTVYQVQKGQFAKVSEPAPIPRP